MYIHIVGFILSVAMLVSGGSDSAKTLTESPFMEVESLRIKNQELEARLIELERQNKAMLEIYDTEIRNLDYMLKKLPDVKCEMVYLNSFDRDYMTIRTNEVEWITDPERLKAIGAGDDEMPSGFYVYDEAYQNQERMFSDGYICKLINGASSVTVSHDEFWSFLEGDAIDRSIQPFVIYIINDKVVEIEQQYLP